MKNKETTPPQEASVYTHPVGLHPVTDTAFEVRAEGRQMEGFIELFAPDVFADCDMSEAVCWNFDQTPALSLKPGDVVGFSTPDGKTAVPFHFMVPLWGAGWHFDPVAGQHIRTIQKISKLYAPEAEKTTPKP